MDLDTKKFIKMIDNKLKISIIEADEILGYYDERKYSESLQVILQNIDIMREIINIYLMLDTKPIPEIKQLQEELISAQANIELKQNKLIVNM
ncbi:MULTISPECIES: hypothetical protein [Bacillus cereus group]|uniref:Uncharacterized protein n=2 Tax=Bacillus cereus group TaxID=86661 RepID=A0AB73UG83_BACCE|nr:MULTISPECIES: hypothetical protein [Bacillus cereus group]MED3026536.1 hypothetical protein [Bacillus wiedmannii]OTX97411.1 hypothetical protein BK729_16365 [Bacillus thuringiensis serovar wratislaviensis]OUB62085.1 hypothetical protein BK743_07000 [Bacillus thuringiensis serovar sylvestriensis]QHV02377.1 hypothetical protein C1N82_02915 [Bacillus cereus]QHV43051.1 hypothetical protein C1N66_07680 [Bacillus cereus]